MALPRLFALVAFVALPTLALPAVAQGETVPLPPPSSMDQGRLVPFTGAQREEWLGECRRRLTLGSHPDAGLIAQSCESWLRYYDAGGRPDPVHGYAIPVAVTQSGGDCCAPCPPKRIVPHRHRKLRDKRVKIVDLRD